MFWDCHCKLNKFLFIRDLPCSDKNKWYNYFSLKGIQISVLNQFNQCFKHVGNDFKSTLKWI